MLLRWSEGESRVEVAEIVTRTVIKMKMGGG